MHFEERSKMIVFTRPLFFQQITQQRGKHHSMLLFLIDQHTHTCTHTCTHTHTHTHHTHHTHTHTHTPTHTHTTHTHTHARTISPITHFDNVGKLTSEMLCCLKRLIIILMVEKIKYVIFFWGPKFPRLSIQMERE